MFMKQCAPSLLPVHKDSALFCLCVCVCGGGGGGGGVGHQKLVACGIFKLELVWVQAVCKGYQQTTLVGKELR